MKFSGVKNTRERWYVCFFSFLYTRLIVIISTFVAFIVLFSRLQVLVVFKLLSLVTECTLFLRFQSTTSHGHTR